MIATLSGVVSEKIDDIIVIDVNGVGYGILLTAEDYGKMNVGEATKVYVYEHIRESAHDLFGFVSRETKKLFELLLSVNGVGPKGALAVLSIGSVNDLERAISSGDVKFISAANGVGKKVAERIVLDLKDKVGLAGVEIGKTGLLQTDGVLRQDDAVEALVALGFSPQDASRALSEVDSGLPTDQRVKEALKQAK